MLKKVSVQAPCKINLALDITGRREDGYHFVKMVMQTVDLCDYVTLEKTEHGGITLSCDREDIPLDNRNIAYRAAEKFFAHTAMSGEGVHIHLDKRIPYAAGLGGGSADGAGVLVGLNCLFDTRIPTDELCHLGLEVGADIPFCIRGGTMLVEGIGEICTDLPAMPYCYIVIAKPKEGVSTKEAFLRYDKEKHTYDSAIDSMVAAIVSGDLGEICSHMKNVLQPVCGVEAVEALAAKLKELGAMGTLMSGSGSAVFGIFDNKRGAKYAYRKLRGEAYNVFATYPMAEGAVVTEFVTET